MSSERRLAICSHSASPVIRLTTAKARLSEPNRSMIAGASGNSSASGRRPKAGHHLHQRVEKFPVLLRLILGDPPPRQYLPAAEAVGEELLAAAFVLEEVEDADRGRDRLGLQLLLEVSLQFPLLVEFLERPPAGEDAVPELDRVLTPSVDKDLRRDDESLTAQLPGRPERVARVPRDPRRR